MIGVDHPNRKLSVERPGFGHIYVARLRDGYTWVAWSNDPRQSVARMQPYCPQRLHLVASHLGSVPQVIDLHDEMRHERVRGDTCWFRPTEHTFEILARHGLGCTDVQDPG